MVDPERLARLLQALQTYRDRLATLRDLPAEDYQLDQAFAGRYLVQASAQAAIDVASHVIASSGWRAPNDFRDAFTVLEEQQVIDAELAERMRALAGLRNRLVHLYADVDDRLVHSSLPEGLDDLSRYAQAIARLAERL
ncbi:MAG: DUF86 domain-containing protein [Solirubrobacteraceae bacterium]|jgi:uncharacterized protein YutE (UPF0331/DUF86 family)